MKLFEVINHAVGLTSTASLKYDSLEHGYEVIDKDGKLIKKFWHNDEQDKKEAYRQALELLRQTNNDNKTNV